MIARNLTLMTDLYQLTMMQGYFKNKTQNETVIFDAFYRSNPCGGGYTMTEGKTTLLFLICSSVRTQVEMVTLYALVLNRLLITLKIFTSHMTILFT